MLDEHFPGDQELGADRIQIVLNSSKLLNHEPNHRPARWGSAGDQNGRKPLLTRCFVLPICVITSSKAMGGVYSLFQVRPSIPKA